MTSTTPPAPTVRDIAYLLELINEARDHAEQIGLRVGMVGIHGLTTSVLAVLGDTKDHKDYLSVDIDGTCLFAQKEPA